MQCHNCGVQLTASDTFCPSCGQKYELPTNPDAPILAFRERFVDAWKKFAKSPLVIIGIVLNVLVFALSCPGYIDTFINTVGQPSQGLSAVLEIIIHVPELMVCIGLVVLLIDSFSGANKPINVRGLTIVTVAQIIQLIMTILTGIITIIGVFMFEHLIKYNFYQNGYDFKSATEAVDLAQFWICAGVIIYIVISILICRMIVRTITDAKESVYSLEPQIRRTTPLAVLTFISAAVMAFVFLAGNAILPDTASTLGGLSFNLLISAMNLLMMGIVLVMYRSLIVKYRSEFEIARNQAQTIRKERIANKTITDMDSPELANMPTWKKVELMRQKQQQ